MSKFKIEKDVPIPSRVVNRIGMIPFSEMDVGNSIRFDIRKVNLNTLRQRVWRENIKNKTLQNKRRYSCFKEDEFHFRVFRIA